MGETTAATVFVDDMMTVAILLSVDAVGHVCPKVKPGANGFVRFEVECLVDECEFKRLEALCFEGGYGIRVDAGKLNQNFRDVRKMMDRALGR
jgi:hypothetical protein